MPKPEEHDWREGRGLRVEGRGLGHNGLSEPLPADLGYHAYSPRYEGQGQMDCHLLDGGKCYYDGSGLNADPVFCSLIHEGSDGVWKRLETYYHELFDEVAA